MPKPKEYRGADRILENLRRQVRREIEQVAVGLLEISHEQYLDVDCSLRVFEDMVDELQRQIVVSAHDRGALVWKDQVPDQPTL